MQIGVAISLVFSVSNVSNVSLKTGNLDRYCTKCEEDDVEEPGGCKWTGTYGDLRAKHLLECPHHMISCPRGCGQEFARRYTGRHGKVCVKRLKPCVVCGDLIKPQEMAAHMKNNAQRHLQMLQASISVTQAEWVIDGTKAYPSAEKNSPLTSCCFLLGGHSFRLRFYPLGLREYADNKCVVVVDGPPRARYAGEVSFKAFKEVSGVETLQAEKKWAFAHHGVGSTSFCFPNGDGATQPYTLVPSDRVKTCKKIVLRITIDFDNSVVVVMNES